MNPLPSGTSHGSLLLRTAVLALLAGTAAAQTTTLINVDFNPTGAPTYSGAAVAGGGTWNGVSVGAGGLTPSISSGALFSSAGLATPITISLGNYRAFNGGGNAAAVATALMTEFVYQPNLGNAGPNSTFSLANLDLTATYDLYLYAQNASFSNTATIFTIGGVSQTATNAGNIANFALNTNYVLYTGLIADPSGIIAGTFNCAQPANNAAFNGLQIVQHGAPPPQPANAANTIKVDFNATDGGLTTYSGNAVAPNSGALWNGAGIGAEGGGLHPSFSSGPLQASDGSNTSVNFTIGNFKVYEANESLAGVATSLMTDFAYQQDLGNTGPNSTFSIGGLNGAFTYDLYLYAQNGGYASTATTFTINGTTKVATDAGNIGTFVEGTNYVLFQGLTPDAFGNIGGTFNCAKPGDNAAFNGFELVVVPEPASLSLLAIGGILAAARRRRS